MGYRRKRRCSTLQNRSVPDVQAKREQWSGFAKTTPIKTEYSIPVDEKLRKDMSAMCNLSQGIRENATDNAINGVIMNMNRDGYSSEQIAGIVEKTIEEVEAVIKKREPALA
jgi:hypothetical protein